MNSNKAYKLKNYHMISLVVCRLLIGWHFLYEGFAKLFNPDWSAKGFLLDSAGFLQSWFFWMADTENVLNVINVVNQWGLIMIGLSLIIGLYSKTAAISGVIMLAFFYLSHPPFIGAEYMLASEGSYLFVNKNLIELSMLIVLALVPTSRYLGIDRLILDVKDK